MCAGSNQRIPGPRQLLLCLGLAAIAGAGPEVGVSAALDVSPQILFVQIGAFERAVGAALLTSELASRGHTAQTIVGDDFHRVVMGPFQGIEDAVALTSRLKQHGYAAYIRRNPVPEVSAEAVEARPGKPEFVLSQLPVSSSSTLIFAQAQSSFVPVLSDPPPGTWGDPPLVPIPTFRARARERTDPAAEFGQESQRVGVPLGFSGTIPQVPRDLVSRTEVARWVPPRELERPFQTEFEDRKAQPEPLLFAVPSTPVLEAHSPATEAVAPFVSVAALSPALVSLPAAIAPVARGLNLRVLEGDLAVNNVEAGVAHDPVVQLLDADGEPVHDAVVTFTLPNRGPSGVFANGSRMLTVMTDEQGKAAGKVLIPKKVGGTMPIQVSASHEGQSARVTILQTNFVPQRRGVSGAKIGIISALTVGVAVGIVKALDGRSQRIVLDPTIRGTATVGPPTVGGP